MRMYHITSVSVAPFLQHFYNAIYRVVIFWSAVAGLQDQCPNVRPCKQQQRKILQLQCFYMIQVLTTVLCAIGGLQ